MMQKFQRKPISVEAVQWDGSTDQADVIIDWVLENDGTATYHCESDEECHSGPEGHTIRLRIAAGADMNYPKDSWFIKAEEGFHAMSDEKFKELFNLELSIEGCTGTVPCECEACRFAKKNEENKGTLFEDFNIVYSGGPSNEVVRG